MAEPAEKPALERDIDLRAVVWTGAAILVMLAVAACAAWLAWHFWGGKNVADAPNGSLDFRMPAPVLESAPRSERETWTAEKERLLHASEWIDRQAGIARIPLEDAMRILADRGKASEGGKR